MLKLLGIAVIVAGFALRLNPLPVIAAAALVTGLAAGLDVVAVISAFGKAFNESRYVSIVWLVLPVIGVLERAGLRERAGTLVSKLKLLTTGRLLGIYFVLRQATAAMGLTSLGGHPQMVRPLVAPMALAAAESRFGVLPRFWHERIRAHAAAADNIANFFGEDIFIAIGSILLMKGFLEQNGIRVEPLQLSLWAIPTALAALLIHGLRLALFERRLARDLGGVKPAADEDAAR
ncbi:MAG: rane protein [Hydrocarboniphaga sp.]|uniref:DUF969 domain-containing protein n=1 Tax=Hydrocarboniphaga sp. TaxID=2033016 RepID=UPI002636D048|nr:DUF969 domain-containing protein [Hydrocarboniphaga sp.]MDB5972978.1 rane protein [Hydrocarboniphaga sp.]